MSLKEFKKIGSNDKFTTFKHPNGSFLKVAHKGITPEYRKKLDSLRAHPAEMDMKGNTKALSNIPPPYQERGAGTDFSNVNNLPKMADGGGIGDQNHAMWRGVKTKIYNWSGRPQGGEPLPQEVKGNPQEVDMPERTADPVDYDDSGPVESKDIPMARGGMVKRYAEGTPDSPVSAQDASLARLNLTKYKDTINSAPSPADQSDASTQGTIGAPSPLAAPVTNDEAVTLAKSPSYGVPSGMADLTQGYQTQLGGIQKQQEAARLGAQANIGMAEQEAGTLGTGINQLNTLNNAYMKHYADIQNERQNLMQEAQAGAAHLDPFRYVKNMSTGDKILSGIGLVLGGIGSGMTHGPNLAADFLQRNIDRDIENQRLQLGVKQNLLGFNFQNSKDLQDATSFTKLNNMDMLSMYLKRQAAQAQNPLQQSTLLNQSGILDQKAGELQNQIAIQRTFRQLGSGQGGASPESVFQQQNGMLRIMGKEGEALAKNRESKHIPGLPGQASTDLSEGDRTGYEEMQNLAKNFQDAQDFLSKSGRIGAPLPGAARTYGQGIMNNMMLSIGKLEDLNRFTHEEGTTYKQMIPDLTGTHFTSQDQGRLNALQQALSNKLSTFKQIHGYDNGAQSPAESAPKSSSPTEVERVTKDKRIAVFDGKTKKFLRYK